MSNEKNIMGYRWQPITFRDAFTIHSGKEYKTVEKLNGKYPVMGTGGIITRTDEPLYDGESVLIGRKGTIDKPVYIDTPFRTVDTLFYTKIKPEYDPKFVFYLVQAVQWKKLSEATGVPSLNTEIIYNVKTYAPQLAVQKEVAEMFASFDDKITAQQELISLLDQQKQGYQQQIFSRKLAFKDDNGNPYPEWEEKELRDIYKSGKAGGTPSSTNAAYYGGEIPFLSISDMTKQGKFVTKTQKTLSEEGLRNSGAWLVPTGSLIYAMYASVGKVCINKTPLTTSQALFCMQIESDKASAEYLYQYLTFFKDKGLKKMITTGTQGNINASSLSSVLIPLPSLPEQEKIAELLAAMDDRIDAEKEKLELLKEQKKGYMQKIFA